MKRTTYFLSIVVMCVVLGLILSSWTYAQDEPCTQLSKTAGTRSSPFNPPTDDVFVTDDGPGLDTGCTFNDDPEHPLIIDIYIDRYVGEVDANGFLVDPDPLITKGIIPSRINIIMPAYDVDFNGAPPPERDEVIFNGENLGLLTGDNNIWKLNSFTVDIRKVKFPSEPPPGGNPSPVANRLQINVDLLATGRWCTAIDWVALVIPIRPEFALTMEVKAGNKIRQNASNNTIDIIYKQSFDTDCNVKNDISSFDEFPFSGPAKSGFLGWFSGEAKLNSIIESCPANSISDPEVKVKWKISGTSLKGVDTWTGLEGDITINMPDKVGAYTVDFTYTIDGSKTITFSRKLLVTKGSPLSQLNTPRRTWYEKATSWASGEEDTDKILEKLLSGLYTFGGANWRYAYDLDAVYACSWKNLIADPITCDYAICYDFSDVFENMAATLGIGPLSPVRKFGSHKNGFVTNKVRSLDGNFPGNAHLLGSTTFDRYLFSSHSLRKTGFFPFTKYYDATFNDVYSTETAFISWNLKKVPQVYNIVYQTDEGAMIYRRPGDAYLGRWGIFDYEPPPTPIAGMPGAAFTVQHNYSGFATMNAQDIQFTGNVNFSTVDTNVDGFFEAVIAEVEVDILTTGEYLISGSLEKNGNTIANQPVFESMSFSEADINGAPGIYTVSLKFSGEQVLESGTDGPYDLILYGTGENSNTTLTVQTPAYDHTQFSETGATITAVTDDALDEDGDGKFDFIEATLDVTVRTVGDYRLQGFLSKSDTTIVKAGEVFSLTSGTNAVKLQFSGRHIRRSGLDGPYEGVINIIDANGHTIGSIEFITKAYSSAMFGALLELDGSFGDQGIDNNGNSLFDILRIEFGADVKDAGTYLVSGALKNSTEPKVVFTDMEISLSIGLQTITLDFIGPLINEQEIDGPYQIEVVVRDPNTFDELDRVLLSNETSTYSYTDFDPFNWAEIMLTGNSTDHGVDTNSNGRFDELHVDVEVELAKSDFYEWSARLTDVNGTEIDFDSRNASLTAGTATINFIFDGEKIGQNGVDGPYFVKGLLMFGQTGPNAVYTDVAVTQPYTFTEFEGSIVPMDTFDIATATISFLKNAKDAFSMTGYFKLGNGSDGFDLNTDEVEVKFGTYSETIPSGSFTGSTYNGLPGAITYMKIKKLIDGSYVFGIKAREVDMDSTLTHINSDSVPIILRIGDDFGDTEIKMIAGKSSWKYMANVYKQDSKGVFEGLITPDGFELKQNYPNPFNPSTTISFTLHEPSNVILAIYNTNGKLVRKLISGNLTQGSHDVIWDGLDKNGVRVASGLYLYRLETSGFVAQKKLIFMK